MFKGTVQNGFFVEAGARDFVTGSNTLWLEMKYNWTGVLVLVEPNPHNYSQVTRVGTVFLKYGVLVCSEGLRVRGRPGELPSVLLLDRSRISAPSPR